MKVFSTDGERFDDEDPEQMAVDYLLSTGENIVTIYEGEAYTSRNKAMMDDIRDEYGPNALAVKNVREYGIYVLNETEDWAELKTEGDK
jgi:hypothetical protein